MPHEKKFANEFEMFWLLFPRKVGKFAARRKFLQARKQASLEVILLGVERYVRTKPAWAEWCHPTTWLSQGRWLDEPERPLRGLFAFACPHTPSCANTRACWVRQQEDREAPHGA